MTDDELVARAREGDAGAFDQLVGRHQAAAFRAALAALRDAADAEDATQDALLRAWRRLPKFRGEASFRTWLLAIVWNCALSRRRSVMRWWARRAPLEQAAAVAAVAEPNGDLRTHIVAAIEALTPTLRDALLLAQSGDYDYGTIARMLGIPVGTVKWRVSEARRKVRARLAALNVHAR